VTERRMVNLRPIEEGEGHLMTWDEFGEACDAGEFIDYDGHGYLATETQVSDRRIWPSNMKDAVRPDWCTHVLWFNR
jgi:hypothetical protein